MSKSLQEIKKKILKSPIMWKFRFYGFFKNLKFFEPYLYILLLTWGLNLFKIGLLFLIQEIIAYIFEIPSGILADKYGKKTELMICFLFYIISFVFFFFGLGQVLNYFFIFVIAVVFFGLGEAFRSGTHKAMIFTWLDKKDLTEYKSLTYGNTRSWSLLGSTLNGLLSIILVIFAPEPRWVFPFAILPYMLDFFLIATYPKYMNKQNLTEGKSYLQEFTAGFKDMFASFKEKRLLKGIFSTSSYDAIYKSLKDYIQPIIKLFIVTILLNIGLTSINLPEEDVIQILLGLLYTIFYLVSSISSTNAYRVKNFLKSSKKGLDWLYFAFALLLILNALFIWIKLPLVVVFLYLFIYVFENIRRPLGVDYLGNIMKKEQRATILSAESQLKSLQVMIFAPVFGYIADISIPILFVSLAGIMILVNGLVFTREVQNKNIEKKERIDRKVEEKST